MEPLGNTEILKKVRKSKSAGNLLSAILDLGKAMITCGGEIWRVKETLGMMFDTYCFKEYDVLVMSNGIHATAKTWDGRIYTQVRQLEGTSYDLDKLERLFSLANEIQEKPLGVDRLKERVYEILDSPGIPMWKGFVGSIIGACGFCLFYNGDINDVIAAGLTAVIVYYISKQSMKVLRNILTANVFAAFAMELIILLMVQIGVAHHAGPVSIANIFLLISGLGFTSGVKNLVYGDVISGIIDTSFSVLGAIGIALGITIAMFVVSGEETGVQVQPLVSGHLMQIISCTVGCTGFAILFGAKGRTIIFSAIGAAINWIIFLLTFNGSIDGLFAAILAGAAFVAFYSAVLERAVNIPSIVILTACIFPLIPGSDLYYTVMGAIAHDYDLFQIHGRMLLLICIGISLGFIIVDVGQKYLHLFESKVDKYKRRK